MSDLRQRRPASAPPAKVSPDGRFVKAPPRSARPPRGLHLALALAIFAFFIVYAQKRGLTKKGVVYTLDAGSRPLPEWYALCGKGGRKAVYTVPTDGGVGAVECVVVGGKRVADIGSLARIRRNWGDKATLGAVDAAPEHIKKDGGLRILYIPDGYTVTPGLTDAHAHPLEYGSSRELYLGDCKSVHEAVHEVEEYVRRRGKPKEGEWIVGFGWNQNKWEVPVFPTAADLDTPLLKGLPIALWRIDVHAAWVSPALLERMGDLPPEVVGGHIERDALDAPTGVFVDNAIHRFITPIRPAWTDADRELYLRKVGTDALAKGLVGVHDAGLPPVDLRFFRRMADEGKLPLRFYTMLLCPKKDSYCGDDAERVTGAGDGRFTLQSVKLFGDGALGSRGAALIDDYSDAPGTKGFLLLAEEVWKPLIRAFYDAGWQVNVHCIGDLANKVVLDAFESAVGPGEAGRAAMRARRLRIEHAQIFTPADLRRAAELGVIGSFQPTHATSDMWYAEDRLGPERIKSAYAWRSYLNLGGRIALGSDFPVEDIDPLKGFYAAVTRRAEDGRSPHGPGGWFPEEKLSREEALRGFTVDAAYASFSEDTGSLTPGMRFDAVLWDDDLLTTDEDELLDVKVKATIMDGRIVYGEWKVAA